MITRIYLYVIIIESNNIYTRTHKCIVCSYAFYFSLSWLQLYDQKIIRNILIIFLFWLDAIKNFWNAYLKSADICAVRLDNWLIYWSNELCVIKPFLTTDTTSRLNIENMMFLMPHLISPGIILCMHPANERRRYIVTSSLIGWVHTQNDPCIPEK